MADEEKKPDKRHLVQRGEVWRVFVAIPKKLQQKLGKTVLQQSLNTTSLKAAQRARWPVIERFRIQIENARKEIEPSLDEQALKLARKKWDDERDKIVIEYIKDNMSEEDGLDPETEGHSDRAIRWGQIAYGDAVPLFVFFDEWKATTQHMAPKSRYEFETRVREFEKFARLRESDFIHKLSDGLVMDWRNYLLQQGKAPATINKALTCLGSYLKHLHQKGIIPHNFARDKAVKNRVTREQVPFTMDELRILLKHFEGEQQDVIAILSTMGFRPSELFNIRVRDIEERPEGLVIRIPKAKTDAGKRVLPVPELLNARIKKLMDGKGPDGYLMAAPKAQKLKERSAQPSREILREMRRLPLRHDVTTLYSSRKFAAWMFENIGKVEPATIARILGHESGLPISLSVYSGESFIPTLREGLDRTLKALPPDLQDLLAGKISGDSR